MNKHFTSLKKAYEKAQNYKIHSETKKFSRKKLEHFFESGIETIANLQHIVESIQFAINDGVTVEEIKKYLEENDKYMIVYPRYEEF